MSRSSSVEESADGVPVPDVPTPPFFNTTFSTHRISPLFIGANQLTERRLELLSRRLRDLLVGDVVRGIQIGLESTETPGGQLGALQSVKIRWFQSRDVLGDEGHVLEEEAVNERQQGLWIEIRHETAAYVALLLPGLSEEPDAAPSWSMQPGEKDAHPADAAQFLHLPLMLMRMPLPLKTVLCEWLSTTFDCHICKLNLGTKTIVGIWEDWIQIPGTISGGQDVTITLAFNAPLAEARDGDEDEDMADVESLRPGLRSVDITISPRDLRKFIKTGEALPSQRHLATSLDDPREHRRLAGHNTDDGWAWLSDRSTAKQPFTNALSRYLDHHLALNLFHPSVRVVQLSCGTFTIAQSKLKILRKGEMNDVLSQAAWMFISRLGQRISGSSLPSVFE